MNVTDDRRGARIFHVFSLLSVGRYFVCTIVVVDDVVRADMLKAKDTRAHLRHTRGYGGSSRVYTYARQRTDTLALCNYLPIVRAASRKENLPSSRARRLMIIVAPSDRARGVLIY